MDATFTTNADAANVGRLLRRLSDILAGNPPRVQGAVLADLLAILLAGHIVKGDAAATEALREQLLEVHLVAVRALVPINAEHIHGRPQ